MKNLLFDEWYVLNRQKLVELSGLWFLPKKWRDLLLTILNTFDLVYSGGSEKMALSVDEERPPIIPIIIIGPDDKPVVLPPSKPKPPVKA
jgi:hypothetical protein